jgi:hypothetical protein
MLLRIFRSNSVYNFFLVPIIGGLLLLKSFLEPGIFPPETFHFNTPLLFPLYLSKISFTGALIINYLTVIIICFQLLYINATFSFVRERTFLPAYLFLFIVFAIPDLHIIQPVFFSGIFILIAFIRIFSSFEKKYIINNAFDAGFFTGLASLFYPGTIILVLLVPISLYTLRNNVGWREFIAAFIGLFLPFLYVFTYYFIFNDISNFIHLFTNVIIRREETILHLLPVQIYVVYLILITIISSFHIAGQYDEKKISTRRYFKILFFYFSTSLLLFILPSVSIELLVILTIPLTFLITNYLTYMRRKFWAELFFTLLIIISVVLQFIVK